MRRHKTAASATATEHAPGKSVDHGMASQLPVRMPGISVSIPAATPCNLGAFTDAPERWVAVAWKAAVIQAAPTLSTLGELSQLVQLTTVPRAGDASPYVIWILKEERRWNFLAGCSVPCSGLCISLRCLRSVRSRF